MESGQTEGARDGVQLNAYFSARVSQPVIVACCPACDAEGPWRPFALVRAHRSSEGAGVAVPAVRCPSCQFVFLNPRLPQEAVASFYRDSTRLLAYFTTGFKDEVDRGRGFLPFVSLIDDALPRRAGGPPSELLDLGCGAGAFISLMRDRGFKVAGAEISPAVARVAREERGLDVIDNDAMGAIEHYRAQGRRFDAVTMIHVFEHLPEPLRVLREVQSVMRPGALLALNVPNVRYVLAPVDRALRTDWAGIWDPIGHFNYFSLRTLSDICARAGLEVVARNSRLLTYGRTGLLGAIDNTVSRICRHFGGLGSNIAVIARKPGAA